MKTKTFTVRTSIEQYERVMEYSESSGITVADLVRQGLDYTCNLKSSENNHKSPESNHPDVTLLQEQIEVKDKTIEELLQQQNQNQKLLVESKRTWIQRLFGLNEREI